MYKLPNITVKQYIKSKQAYKYNGILDHVKGEPLFIGKSCDIMALQYTTVKYCLQQLSNVKDFDYIAEVFTHVFEVTKDEFYKAPILDYFKARNHINEVFKVIYDNEKRLAQGGNTDVVKWKMAGGERLAQYDTFLPLDQLGERYGCYPPDLGRKPYSEIFYLMAMTKTLNEVNYNYTTMK